MFDPKTLHSIEAGTDINALESTKLRNLQRALSWMTYPVSVIDGLIGPNTRSAFAEFKMDIGEDDGTRVTASSIDVAINEVSETQAIMGSDVTTQEKTKRAIGDLCTKLGIGLKTQIAYVLATTQWETNHTFEPVKEAYWKSETWRRNNLHYYPYYGRGYVQLTWKSNYRHYSRVMREKLTSDPDLALKPEIALLVLVHGFKLGAFTGRKITDYVNEAKTDFKNARRCINGLDKWEEIKDLAEDYLEEL